MSPEQALELLDQVCQSVQANRITHAKIIEAIKVLGEVLKKSKP